jgi:hypothetical protein
MKAEAVVGGIYSYAGADGQYRVCKILTIDERAVHVRQYANRYDERPNTIPPDLTLNGSTIATVGIGHMPVDRDGFLGEPHDLLGIEAVRIDELDGYNEWQRGYADDEEPDVTRVYINLPKLDRE